MILNPSAFFFLMNVAGRMVEKQFHLALSHALRGSAVAA